LTKKGGAKEERGQGRKRVAGGYIFFEWRNRRGIEGEEEGKKRTEEGEEGEGRGGGGGGGGGGGEVDSGGQGSQHTGWEEIWKINTRINKMNSIKQNK
jgi:hypothetical protein